MMRTDAFIWTLFGGCLAVSFLLSGMEAGVFALSRLRIRQQMRAGRRAAKALQDYLENPENFLWTILVGNTLANFVILGWPVFFLHRFFEGQLLLFVLAYAFWVLIFFIFFDLLPKTLFRAFPNRLCMLAVGPFRLLHRLVRPFVMLVESVSGFLLRWRGGHAFTGRLFGNREELRLLMQESAKALTSEEALMINRVLDFQTATVRQIMKPLDKAVTVTVRTTVGETLALCRESKHTRLPVWGERDGRPRIIGMLSCNRLLFQPDRGSAMPISEHVTAALYLDEDLRLELALQRMQRSGQRLAIVVGRDRVEKGIISLRDILQFIFGEVSL